MLFRACRLEVTANNLSFQAYTVQLSVRWEF